MILNDRMNIIDWMTDIWTTPALSNSENFGVALAQMCKQYLLCHGSDPKNIMDIMKEFDSLYNILRKTMIKNRHTDTQE